MPLAVTLGLTFVAFVAMNAARVVLTLYALTLGAPASLVGVLGGIFYLFPLLLSWPIGSAADRIGPRRLLLTGAITGTGALLLPYFVPELRAFYAAAALSGLALAYYHVTLQNLIGVLSEPHQRARNFSNFSLVGATTTRLVRQAQPERVLGPIVFGAVGSAFGVPSVFWINAVIMGATGFMSRRGAKSI